MNIPWRAQPVFTQAMFIFVMPCSLGVIEPQGRTSDSGMKSYFFSDPGLLSNHPTGDPESLIYSHWLNGLSVLTFANTLHVNVDYTQIKTSHNTVDLQAYAGSTLCLCWDFDFTVNNNIVVIMLTR